MPFKEEVTNNIYKSWFKSVSFARGGGGWYVRELNSFSLDELSHLKWLIEQEINGKADNSSCEE